LHTTDSLSKKYNLRKRSISIPNKVVVPPLNLPDIHSSSKGLLKSISERNYRTNKKEKEDILDIIQKRFLKFHAIMNRTKKSSLRESLTNFF